MAFCERHREPLSTIDADKSETLINFIGHVFFASSRVAPSRARLRLERNLPAADRSVPCASYRRSLIVRGVSDSVEPGAYVV
jgi:hypothetical protein